LLVAGVTMGNSGIQIRPSPTAIAYAQSLLELASEQKQAEPADVELAALRTIVEQTPSAREIFTNPAIGIAERQQILDRIFRGRISELVFNLLGVMNQHDRLGLIAEVAQAYHDMLDVQLGKVEVDLIVAHALDSDALVAAQQKISAALGKTAVVNQRVDESIIGGIIVKVGDKLIDSSVKHQLEAMKQQLLASVPK